MSRRAVKCNILQGRGRSISQMFGKAGIFVICLTKTFVCHHLGLIQCVPSSPQVTCWVHYLSQQGEPWEELSLREVVNPEGCGAALRQ